MSRISRQNTEKFVQSAKNMSKAIKNREKYVENFLNCQNKSTKCGKDSEKLPKKFKKSANILQESASKESIQYLSANKILIQISTKSAKRIISNEQPKQVDKLQKEPVKIAKTVERIF